MQSKLFGIFSGTHLTILAGIAMIVPGAVYGAATLTQVVITGSSTGAYVTPGRALFTLDAQGQYANNPLNYIRQTAVCANNTSTSVYTPPAGKAAIIKAVTFAQTNGTAGTEAYDYLGVSPNVIAAFEDKSGAASFSADLGNGFFVRNGEFINTNCKTTGQFYATFVGYLVPSTAVPAAASPAK